MPQPGPAHDRIEPALGIGLAGPRRWEHPAGACGANLTKQLDDVWREHDRTCEAARFCFVPRKDANRVIQINLLPTQPPRLARAASGLKDETQEPSCAAGELVERRGQICLLVIAGDRRRRTQAFLRGQLGHLIKPTLLNGPGADSPRVAVVFENRPLAKVSRQKIGNELSQAVGGEVLDRFRPRFPRRCKSLICSTLHGRCRDRTCDFSKGFQKHTRRADRAPRRGAGAPFLPPTRPLPPRVIHTEANGMSDWEIREGDVRTVLAAMRTHRC